jgi:formylglycine-generating enzyme required for sulfatase activity
MDNSVNNQLTKGADGQTPVPPAGRADAADRSLGDRATMPGAAGEPVDDRSMGGVPTMRPDGARPAGRRFRSGDRLLGRYRVEEELGQGGMGVVYRCLDEVSGADVALKALPPEVAHNSGEMEEVRANFRLVSKLHHPNIANVNTLERDPATGDYYLIMECVDGYDVRQWVRRRRDDGRPLTLEEVTIIAYRIAEALDYAHGQGVIHRDIKPSNVRVNFEGEVKVLDFGLAAQIQMSLSRVSQAVHGTSGTGPYMAPEQWMGRRQGAAADQYALAATVYELLGGSPPFENHDTAILREAVLKQEALSLEDMPVYVNAALLRALSKEPEKRFASCGEFVKSLAGKGAELGVRHEASSAFGAPSDKGVGGQGSGLRGQHVGVSSTGLRTGGWRKWVGLASAVALACGTYVVYRAFHAGRVQVALFGIADPASSPPVTVPSSVDAKQPQTRDERGLSLELGNKVSMNFALIPAGTFMMGSPESEDKRRPDEGPQHEVTISQPFYIGVTHVTVDQFAEFVKDSGYTTDAEKEGVSEGFNIKDGQLGIEQISGLSWRHPGFDQKGNHPVVQVSWEDAKVFCEWLSKKSGQTVALPTEAQWEYACRAGTKTAYPWGDNSDDGKGCANGADQSLMGMLPNSTARLTFFSWDDAFVFTSPVGSFKANSFGLYDMIGNAAHWCEDRYGQYGKGAVTDPKGNETSINRVVRGGSWNNFSPQNCRSAARYKFLPGYRNNRYGFRVAVEMTPSLVTVPGAAMPSETALKSPLTATRGNPWTNSLGMVFLPVPGTAVRFSIWDARVQDYQAFAAATGRTWEKPSFEQGPTHPAVNIRWEDAKAFCTWLTEKERGEGVLNTTEEYRLPMDLEWSAAVGLQNESGSTPKERQNGKKVFPWSTQWPPPRGAGNYGKKLNVDDFDYTSPVGSFAPNRFGLYDMGGNVWQWCEDWYDTDQKIHVQRGASFGGNDWYFHKSTCRSDFAEGIFLHTDFRLDRHGFRCVLTGGGVSASR